MLRATLTALGRWNSRDFLKGRGKKAGSVHVRHTHGSKGRYPRLSSRFGIRDGRRHAMNRMKGGLGIKLGGGLFGARIPRQQRLSTMTAADYDLEVYGHPNITNPYREQLERHPTLRRVMDNACVGLDVVLLLPRAARYHRRRRHRRHTAAHGTASRTTADKSTGTAATAAAAASAAAAAVVASSESPQPPGGELLAHTLEATRGNDDEADIPLAWREVVADAQRAIISTDFGRTAPHLFGIDATGGGGAAGGAADASAHRHSTAAAPPTAVAKGGGCLVLATLDHHVRVPVAAVMQQAAQHQRRSSASSTNATAAIATTAGSASLCPILSEALSHLYAAHCRGRVLRRQERRSHGRSDPHHASNNNNNTAAARRVLASLPSPWSSESPLPSSSSSSAAASLPLSARGRGGRVTSVTELSPAGRAVGPGADTTPPSSTIASTASAKTAAVVDVRQFQGALEAFESLRSADTLCLCCRRAVPSGDGKASRSPQDLDDDRAAEADEGGESARGSHRPAAPTSALQALRNSLARSEAARRRQRHQPQSPTHTNSHSNQKPRRGRKGGPMMKDGAGGAGEGARVPLPILDPVSSSSSLPSPPLSVPSLPQEGRVTSADGEGNGSGDTHSRSERAADTADTRDAVFADSGSASARGAQTQHPRAGLATTPAPSGRKSSSLLRAEVQYDETQGVWALPRGLTSELVRWHYSRSDPRAHHADAVPHRQRRLRVLLLLDASKAPRREEQRQRREGEEGEVAGEATQDHSSFESAQHRSGAASASASAAAAASSTVSSKPVSLMDHDAAWRLRRAGCLPVAESSLAAVLDGIGEWAVDRQWEGRPLRSHYRVRETYGFAGGGGGGGGGDNESGSGSGKDTVGAVGAE